MPIILPATKPQAEFQPWNPVYLQVVEALLQSLNPLPAYLAIEHVGSTSIPGCAGKGIIDLLGIYEPGFLEPAKNYFLGIGFCKQGAEYRKPWPEHRPAYLGNFEFSSQRFLIYVHVVQKGSDEIRRFRDFKDILLSSSHLISEYSEFKKELIHRGVLDTDDYAVNKRPFMHRILGDRHALQKGSE